MPTTTPDGIYYVDDATGMSIKTITTAEATSIQAAFTARFGGVSGKVKGITVSSASARDALFPAPAVGDTVFRSDKQWAESYFSTGVDSPGWFPTWGRLPLFNYTTTGGTGVSGGTTQTVGNLAADFTAVGATMSANVITIAQAGVYRLDYGANFDNASGDSTLSITKNGTATGIAGSTSRSPGGSFGVYGTRIVKLASGDTIRGRASISSPGGNVTVAYIGGSYMGPGPS